MDKDRLINLLPEEFLPEPEFKAFPIFAAVLIIATVLFIWFQIQADDRTVKNIKRQAETIGERNKQHQVEAEEFLKIQANARFIRSYLAVIPRIVLQAPDYWAIYNEIENDLPEDTWVQSVSFRGGKPTKWPEVTVSFLSRGYGFNGPLVTYDSLKGTAEHPTRFKNLRMGGYRRTLAAGAPAATFEIKMEVKFPQETEK